MSDWYQIENNSYTVQITTLGAEMKRLFSKPWNRELLWNPLDENAKKLWMRTAPVLFPIVGRLKDDLYRWGGKSYQMTQHGFARDMEFKCIESGESLVTFVAEATQKTYALYPFLFELAVTYSLEGPRLNITYTVKNVDRQDIYFSIGAHPGFETANRSDYEIQFEHQEQGFFQLENGLVNWRNLTVFPDNKIIPDQTTFKKDALILKEVKSRYIDLVNKKRHETIRVSGTDTPYLGIWGKEAVPFICIEPWFGVSDDLLADGNLERKKGIQVLAEGGTFQFSYAIEML
jgi:galactose mutarotase-like enzyme